MRATAIQSAISQPVAVQAQVHLDVGVDMAQTDDLQIGSRRALDTLGATAALLWQLIRLPVYGALVICEPVVRFGLTTIAVLGIGTAMVLEFSGSAPRFPFWGALLFFGCCGALPAIYRSVLRLLAP